MDCKIFKILLEQVSDHFGEGTLFFVVQARPTHISANQNNDNNNTDFTYKYFFSLLFIFLLIWPFLLDFNNISIKNKNLEQLMLLNESQNKEWWSVSYITCADIMAQVSLTRWSTFLFLGVLTLKLRIVVIILTTDPPTRYILPTTCTTES